jgi:hypothetical protein
MINDLKSDKVSKIPTSIWQSFISGKLFQYLKVKIMNDWIFSDKTSAYQEKVGHFQ